MAFDLAMLKRLCFSSASPTDGGQTWETEKLSDITRCSES
jgi:hypothetical protein